MNDEKIKILEMLESRKISAKEAADLLEALEERKTIDIKRGDKPAWLRIKVYDEITGKSKVNVNLPYTLINFALKFIPKEQFNNDKIDFDEIFNAIKQGAQGKLIDVVDDEKGEHIEIYIE